MSPSSPQRVVFDTNALISAAILPKSVCRQALLHAVEHMQLVLSQATWWELAEVLGRKKFDRYLPVPGRDEFLLSLARVSEFLDISISINDCRDPKDNRFLELAIEAWATIIVSGDKHLLEMHRYQDIDILEPADFLRAQAQRIDLNEAIGAADRGEFASDEEVGDFFGKHGG